MAEYLRVLARDGPDRNKNALQQKHATKNRNTVFSCITSTVLHIWA